MTRLEKHKTTKSHKTYFIKDWLLLHQITGAQLKHLLCFTHHYPSIPNAVEDRVNETAQHIWNLVTEALTDFWPEHDLQINKAFNCTETKFSSDTSTPFNLDNGIDQSPSIEINYQHSPVDALHIAHEFGHALQIICCRSAFISPIQRELAALLIEKVFLKYVQDKDNNLANLLLPIWHSNRCTYLGTDLNAVKHAMENPQSTYNYRWNYPIAHILLETLFHNSSKLELWSMVEGSTSLEELLSKCTSDFKLKLNNYLPPYMHSDAEPKLIDAYRALGMAALLDVETWQGLAENKIDAFYKQALHHLQNNSLLVVTNAQHQASGYATWKQDTHGKIIITHQTAPFGDHLLLLKKLQRHLPNILQANAYHPSSSNKEQIAWHR